jgi:hypothetical protein
MGSEGSDEKISTFSRASSHLIKKKPNEDTHDTSTSHFLKDKIGPLTLAERMDKVMRYLQRKRQKNGMKKFCYKCRKQVAEKRLRIKGRFVTK